MSSFPASLFGTSVLNSSLLASHIFSLSPLASKLFWSSVTFVSWLWLVSDCFPTVSSSDSFSFSESPDEIVPSGRWLFFLCFFLLFFFFLECLWRRLLWVSSFGDRGFSSGFSGLLFLLLRLLFLFLSPSLLVCLELSLMSSRVFVFLSLLSLSSLLFLFLDFLSLSLLLFRCLSSSLSLLLLLDLSLLLLRHLSLPLSLCVDLNDHLSSLCWWEDLLSRLLSLLLLLHLPSSRLLWDRSDLGGLLLQWRCLHPRSTYLSECHPSLWLPLALRSGDMCRSLSASQNSLPGFRNTCRKLQFFPLGHFCLSNNPEEKYNTWDN